MSPVGDTTVPSCPILWQDRQESCDIFMNN